METDNGGRYTVYEFIGAALAAGAHMMVEESSATPKMVKQSVSEFLGTSRGALALAVTTQLAGTATAAVTLWLSNFGCQSSLYQCI